MELELLRVFQEVAEQESFTRAAETFHLNQSSISHKIAALERELHCKLLLRRRPHCALTPEGRRLLELTRPLLQQLDEIYEQFGASSDIHRRLRLAMGTVGATYLFGSVCQDFIRLYPHIHLSVHGTSSVDDTMTEVLTERVDVGLGTLPADNEPLATIRLGYNSFILVAGAELDVPPRIEAPEVASLPFIVNGRETLRRRPFEAMFSQLEGPPRVVLESSELEFIKRMVAIGLGVAILPAFAVRREIASGELRWVEIAGWDFRGDYGLMYLPHRLSGPLRAFLQFCESRREVLQALAAYP